MKKIAHRKLRLETETLKTLTSVALRGAAGGALPRPPTMAICPTMYTCQTGCTVEPTSTC